MTSFSSKSKTAETAVPGFMVLPQDAPCRLPNTQTALAILIDQRREKAAELAGLDMQIAMALGDRDLARKHLREMEAQVGARMAMREACFFDKAGEADRRALRGRVAA